MPRLTPRFLIILVLALAGFVLYLIADEQASGAGLVALVLVSLLVWLTAAALALFTRPRAETEHDRVLRDPAPVQFLLQDAAAGILWLPIRLYVGWEWLHAGWEKWSGDSAIGWTKDGIINGRTVHAGDSILGFWQRAYTPNTQGATGGHYGWFNDVLRYMAEHDWNGWFTYVVSAGEVLVGAFTGIAAFFGATMNFNFMLAGSASSNPVLFAGAVLLFVGWKTAGQIGLDRWLLPAVGVPWRPGRLFQRDEGQRPGRMRPAAT
jgi:thiosulfate dehydrogenase [quinone] large subunit